MATADVAQEVEAGMPQLDFSTFPNQIFWLLIALVVIYLVLSRIALPRISGVLAERSGTISNDLAAAEDFKLRATEAEAVYEKALADARIESNRIGDEARAVAQADLDAALAEADAKIATQTAAAEANIAEIRASATDNVAIVAKDVAQALVAAMGTNADQAAIDAAVANRMKG
ncbi:F0F1 ATP synthase subunit B' [Loktanella salsilacus]|jgi:F-type H+-transporting ATPase subunit b|uniref:F0F1 ATP synthase subunit B' n=1 Tax=Loktanella salsilacus TaxID=195913 RepID=UPI0020B7C643|nr:F0F1 ATP synthase subunit B' [Loktanella salsilacus]UTH44214.1 F0F1 ATP synthase subunit B' [Loktanella salsilacus]